MKNRNLYFVILAGGSGTRLWPLSTSRCPKQLLTLADGKTLLEKSIQLVRGYIKAPAKVVVSAGVTHEEQIRQAVGTLIDQLSIEPCARNTGPAILYACLRIYEDDPDALVLFLPADAHIPEQESAQFIRAVERAFEFANTHEALSLFGVKPTYPATGYGYIEYHANMCDGDLHSIKKFHEKPVVEVAQEYLACSTMLWNIGMFCGQVSVFLNEFKKHAPQLYKAVQSGSFEQAPSLSIDYAVIEKSQNVWVQPVDFSWCDVGNLDLFLALKQQVGDKHIKLLQRKAENNIVDASNKLVALVGVNNLCVIQTEDVLLIADRNEIENIGAVVQQLHACEWHEYL